MCPYGRRRDGWAGGSSSSKPAASHGRGREGEYIYGGAQQSARHAHPPLFIRKVSKYFMIMVPCLTPAAANATRPAPPARPACLLARCAAINSMIHSIKSPGTIRSVDAFFTWYLLNLERSANGSDFESTALMLNRKKILHCKQKVLTKAVCVSYVS